MIFGPNLYITLELHNLFLYPTKYLFDNLSSDVLGSIKMFERVSKVEQSSTFGLSVRKLL